MHDPKSQFGERLRTLRQRSGYLRARHAAKALGISENSYTRYERGQSEPSIALICRILREFRISANELFGIEPGPRDDPPQGFGETSAAALSEGGDWARGSRAGPIASRSAPPAPPPAPALGAEAAAWSLARRIAETREAAKSEAPAEEAPPLAELPIASEIFFDLERAPYRTIARLLASPEIGRLPRKVQSGLRVEIDRFLAAIDRGSPADPPAAGSS